MKMTTKRLLVVAFAASALSACGSYKGDLEKICNAPVLAGDGTEANLAEIGPWLEKNVRTRKGRKFLQNLAGGWSLERAQAEMQANGVAPCPLLDPRVTDVPLQLPSPTETPH